jgi:hypothetical protein
VPTSYLHYPEVSAPKASELSGESLLTSVGPTSTQMSAAPVSPSLPRLPGLRNCDYRAITAPSVAVYLPEADVKRWQRALCDKARLIVLGTTVIETITMELLYKIRPRLDAEQLEVRCS